MPASIPVLAMMGSKQGSPFPCPPGCWAERRSRGYLVFYIKPHYFTQCLAQEEKRRITQEMLAQRMKERKAYEKKGKVRD